MIVLVVQWLRVLCLVTFCIMGRWFASRPGRHPHSCNEWKICYHHLSFIWDRHLIPSSQKSGMKMSQTSPASRWILWHPSASEVAAEEMIHPTSTHCSSLLSLTVAYICFTITLIILRDTLSWRARLLITHPCMFIISGSSLAFFLPAPGSPVAVLLGQMLKLS